MRRSSITVFYLTAITAVAVAAALIIVNALRNPVSGSVIRYTAIFTDASGLVLGNDVRISGVQVGKVEGVSLDGKYARVVFTVQASRSLFQDTTLAIRYQSLLGQRYVEVGQPAAMSPALAAGSTIPVSKTVPSFDVAKLFNGFRPLFQTLDPAQFNAFGENILRVIQGDADGIGPVLHDIDGIMKVAVDRRAAIAALIHNLSDLAQDLGGTSRQLLYLITSLTDVLGAFTAKADEFNSAVDTALPTLRNVVHILQYTEQTLDSANTPVYDLLSRMFPQTPTIMAGISMVPDLVQGMRDALVDHTKATPSFACSHGVAHLPGIGEVSFANQDLVLCD